MGAQTSSTKSNIATIKPIKDNPLIDDLFIRLPADIRCLLIQNISNYADYQNLSKTYPSMKSLLKQCVISLFNTQDKILSIDKLLKYDSLVNSDFVLRIDTYEQLFALAGKKYLQPRIMLSNDFMSQFDYDRRIDILYVSLYFMFNYFQTNKFISTNDIADSSNNNTNVTSISIITQDELLKYGSYTKALYFGHAFYLSGIYGGSILYCQKFQGLYINANINKIVIPAFLKFAKNLVYPISLYSLYFKLFKYLGVPCRSLMIAQTDYVDENRDVRFLNNCLAGNFEIKNLVVVVPTGAIANLYTVDEVITLATHNFTINSLNIAQIGGRISDIPVRFHESVAHAGVFFFGIKKLALFYSPKHYDADFLIQYFPNLKMVSFIFPAIHSVIDRDYLLSFLTKKLIIHLIARDQVHSNIDALYEELHLEAGYPLFVSEKMTNLTESFATIYSRMDRCQD
jgi:hypothetical protein